MKIFLQLILVSLLAGGARGYTVCYSCSSGDVTGLNLGWLFGKIPPTYPTCNSSSLSAVPTVNCNSYCISDYLNIAVPWSGLSRNILIRGCADSVITGKKNPGDGNCCKSVNYNFGGIYFTGKGCTCNSINCNSLTIPQINTNNVMCADPCSTNPCLAGQTCKTQQNGLGYTCNGGNPTQQPATTQGPTTTYHPPTTTTPSPNAYQRLAKIFTNSINTSVNPCQDFYQFSCGNWIKNHPIPKSSSSVSGFGILDSSMTSFLNSTLRMSMNGSMAWPTSIQQTMRAFKSCISINSQAYNGQRVLGVVRAYGGWPASNPGWTTNQAGLLPGAKFMGVLNSKFGRGNVLSSYVDLDYRHNYKRIFHVGQADLTYPTIYYTTPSTQANIRNSLTKLMTSVIYVMASVQGTNPISSSISTDVTAMVDLEFQLAKFNVPSANQRNASLMYNIFSLTQAMARWPNLNLDQFFSGTLSPLSLQNQSLVQQRFCVDFPSYFDSLNSILQSGSQRLLQNYLVWRMIYPYLEFLPSTRGAFEEFKKSMDDIEALPDMSASCVGTVTAYLPYTVGRLYIDEHFNKLPSMPRAKLTTMIMSVLGAFRQMISQLNWMDLPSKIIAINKVNGIVKNVAYPDWIMNNNQLNQMYQQLMIGQSDNFWTVMQKLTTFQQTQGYQLLFMPDNRADFSGSPATVNAWYQPQYNSITFPAGILNPPFFEADYPASVNYGAMGVVMGHELTHGFDDEGVQWDKNGTLHTWLDEQSTAGFKNMAKCIINEYSQFCFPSLPEPNCVSGIRTQGENIADNGGIKAAYIAFKSNQILNGVDPPLPGPVMSKYTQDQLFFMSFGQVWCRNIKTSSLPRQLLLDPHAPARDRVIGTVKNFPLFGKAFNCPAGSPMYPANHCNIW